MIEIVMALKKFAALALSALKVRKTISRENEQALAKDLDGIIRTLTQIQKSFAEGKIPRQQAYELAMMTNFAHDKFKAVFPIPHVEKIFRERMPKVGHLMRHADYFIDGKRRDDAGDPEYEARDYDMDVGSGDRFLLAVREEIDRAIGELRGAYKGLTGKAVPVRRATN